MVTNVRRHREAKTKQSVSRSRLRAQFLSWHQMASRLDDARIDQVLGIQERMVERGLNMCKLAGRYASERYEYGGTSYSVIRDALKGLDPCQDDVFYDLGAGYGRVLFYGALTYSARFRGIELVPQRVTEANRIKRRLSLKRLDFRQGNAQTVDFSDGNLFFFANPFFSDVLRVVGARLRKIASVHSIKIASVGDSNIYFAKQRWLAERNLLPIRASHGPFDDLRFFVSTS